MELASIIWNHILALKEKLKKTDGWEDLDYTVADGFSFASTDGERSLFKVHRGETKAPYQYTISMCNDEIYLSYNDIGTREYLQVLRLYLPILLQEKVSNTVTVLCHVAQSLDGMISTVKGHSKWIGNEQNLIHAHRLRALVDGVIVGGKTIAIDLPRLDVRHVEGNNPKRILLSNTFSEIDVLPTIQAETILLRREGNKLCTSSKHSCSVLEYDEHCKEGAICSILSRLKEQNIHSVMVEGGAQTISSFLKAGTVDFLQVHIAPIVFGSGRKTFALPEILKVDDGWKLDSVLYTQMGDAMMITGQPIKNRSGVI